jgi:hypothetical protein
MYCLENGLDETAGARYPTCIPTVSQRSLHQQMCTWRQA